MSSLLSCEAGDAGGQDGLCPREAGEPGQQPQAEVVSVHQPRRDAKQLKRQCHEIFWIFDFN